MGPRPGGRGENSGGNSYTYNVEVLQWGRALVGAERGYNSKKEKK